MKNRNYIAALILIFQVSMTFAGSFINGTMVHGGSTRKYVVYVPTIYTTQNIKVPLLVGLHGNGDNASNFSGICMSSISDTANYITVYPEALPDPILTTNAWHSGAGTLGFEVNSTVDDVGFINRLMDTMIARYMIDTNRMYVFGFSFGGFMTNKMAASSAKRFSAAACVSGERGNFNTSIPVVPVPYLHFHGTADDVITYDGSTGSFPPLGATPDSTTRFWAIKNGCSLTPVIDTMPNIAADGLTFIRYSYNHASNNNKAILYKVVNGTHDWYFRPTNDIDYCQTIWSFFRQYSKTATTTPTPTASFTASDTTVCKGGSLTFTSTSTASSGSLDSIRWTISGGTPSTGTTTTISSSFNTVATYVITLKAYKSGNVSTATKSIRVKPLPTVTVTSPSICSGQTAQPVASGANTYMWTGGLPAVSNPTTPVLTTNTTYTVTGTTNFCTGTAISTVTVKPKPIVTVTSPSICSGQTAQPVASGATNYAWTGGLSAVSNPVTSVLTTTTTYTVTGTTNGCTGTAISTVTVKPKPTITVTSPSICSGQSAQPVASGASTYTWTGGLAAVSNPTTPVLTTTTTYTVTGTTNGCTGTAISTVSVNTTAPTVTISPNPASVCSGSPITLTGNGANNYTWTNSQTGTTTGSTLTFTPTGNITVNLSGTLTGCTTAGTASINVTVKLKPTVTVTSPSICSGQTAQPVASGATTYSWTGGLTAVSNPVTPTLTTTTTYTVTGSTNGCTGTAISTVTVKPKPTVTVTSPSICSGQTAQPVASGATTYAWTGGLTAVSNPVTPALTTTTTYAVTGTTNGCTGNAVSTVTVKMNPIVTVTSPTICSGQTAQPVASGATSYSWTGGLTAVSNPVTPSLTTNTTYTVTGTTNGCTGTAVSGIVVKPLPATPTITQRNDSLICSVTGGASYTWYKGGSFFITTTGPKLKLTQNGTYTVEVTGTNTCVSLKSANFNAVITGIKNNKTDIEFAVFPNPSKGSFEISITGVSNKTYQLRLYNINGQIIVSDEMTVRAGQNLKRISLEGIEKGVYTLSIIGDNGISNKNIIVQ